MDWPLQRAKRNMMLRMRAQAIFGGALLLHALGLLAAACSDNPPPFQPPTLPTGSTPPPDSGSPQLTDSSFATGCTPQAVTPQVPPWKQPHGLHMNLCNAEEAAALASCFIEKKNCEVGVRQLCHDCATSGVQSQFSSPLIYDAANQPAELNVEGCVGLLAGDPSANGCGAKLSARYACGAQACTTCTDDASKEACSKSAGTSVCATQEAAAACATQFIGQCKNGTTETQVAYNLLAIFCGP